MTDKGRINKDVARIMMSEFPVKLVGDNLQEFHVLLHGPKESLYEGGVWKVRVELPDTYPYKSPSIGFLNKIYHPNIDEHSGSVCLDVINQTWSPMFSIYNIFDSFLPQLLIYPNPADPLNGTASNLFHHDKDQYEETVKKYVTQFANPCEITVEFEDGDRGDQTEQVAEVEAEAYDDDDDDDDLSDIEADVIVTLQAKRRQSSTHSTTKIHITEHFESIEDDDEDMDLDLGDFDDDEDEDDDL